VISLEMSTVSKSLNMLHFLPDGNIARQAKESIIVNKLNVIERSQVSFLLNYISEIQCLLDKK
jgi:hypothetical protein